MENDGCGSCYVSVNLTVIDSSTLGDGKSQGILECRIRSARRMESVWPG